MTTWCDDVRPETLGGESPAIKVLTQKKIGRAQRSLLCCHPVVMVTPLDCCGGTSLFAHHCSRASARLHLLLCILNDTESVVCPVLHFPMCWAAEGHESLASTVDTQSHLIMLMSKFKV